jgi:hypothetical protein
MSDVMDLETPEPPAALVAEAVAPPAPPAPPADPDEVNAIEVQGGKMVPLPALKAAREEARAAKEQAGQVPQLQQQIAQLTGQVTAFQEVQRTLAQSRQEAFAPPAPTQADPDLIDLARSLDYYKQDGTPDLARAQKHAALIQKEATKIAQGMVAPLHQRAAQTQSAANYQAALQVKSPQGLAPKPETLQWMWNNLPAEYTADPRVAQALPALAMGLEALQGNGSKLPPQPPPPANPPLVTEGIGGAPPQRLRPLSETERGVLAARGIDEKHYTKLTENFRSGRTSTLED